jgi:tetratricopeptide (TPR) repeat protein
MEVELASHDFISQILKEGEDFIEKAADIGADVSDVEAQFDEVGKALDEKDFATAHEVAKMAVETAKTLPKKFVQGKIAEARTKVMTVVKIGADAMMAKNYLIKARSSMAGGDLAGAMKAYESCMAELDKAPKTLVNKKIANAKSNIERVRAMGQNTEEVDGMMGQAEAKVEEGDFEGALKLLEEGLNALKEIEKAGTEVTNVLFEVDMAVAMAAEAGKDISEARKKLDEAFSISATDPAKAKELALEVKQMLED